MEKEAKNKEVKMKGPNYKGSYQYITRKKTAYILRTLLFIGIGVAIFVLGLFLNKFNSSNIFTLLAILMVLPVAKAMVAVAVFWPFKSVTLDRIENIYQNLVDVFPEIAPMETVMSQPDAIEDKLNVYFDMVFTSSEKVMNMDACIITGSRLIGLQGREKPKLSYLQTYLAEGMEKRGLPFGVKIYDKEEAFLKVLKQLKPEDLTASNVSKRDRDAVVEFIETIIVK